VVLVGLAADERLDAHRVFADREDRVGGQPALAGQRDHDTGQSAVRAFVQGVVQPVLDERVLDDLLDAFGHARTPRRIEKRLPPRRVVASWRGWRAR
jgi:hypothetical protein